MGKPRVTWLSHQAGLEAEGTRVQNELVPPPERHGGGPLSSLRKRSTR